MINNDTKNSAKALIHSASDRLISRVITGKGLEKLLLFRRRASVSVDEGP